jgi:hypothetical protein
MTPMTNQERDRHFDVTWDGSLYPLPSSDPSPAATLTPEAIRELLDRSYPDALVLADIAAHFGVIRDLAWPGLVVLLNAGMVERVMADGRLRQRLGSGRPPTYAYREAIRREA